MSDSQGSADQSAFAGRLRFDGRTVIVAGAGGGGNGTFTVRALAELGARVIAVDIDASALESIADISTPIVADLRDLAQHQRVLGAALADGHHVDGLVNIVGGAFPKHWAPTLDYSAEQWDDVIDFNLRYAMFLAQACARSMIDAGRPGAIVHLASVSGVASAPFHVGYGVAKAALMQLTRTMAVEWGRFGIRVNCVAPGTIAAPRTQPGPADVARDQAAIPLGRRGRPDEIAAAVTFLLSDLASYVSGHTLVVDAAMSAKPAFLGSDDMPVFVTNPEIRARASGG